MLFCRIDKPIFPVGKDRKNYKDFYIFSYSFKGLKKNAEIKKGV